MGMGRLRDFTATSLVGELQSLQTVRLWWGPASSINEHAFLISKANADDWKSVDYSGQFKPESDDEKKQ